MSAGGHTPVLPREVDELLAVREGETVVDLTVGLGGHAWRLAQRLGPAGMLIGLDVDPVNLAAARDYLAGCSCRVELLHANFAEVGAVLASLGLSGADVLLADLGVSSTQLDVGARGFSFQQDGPLDMRMDPRLGSTAADLINRLKEKELSDLLYYNAQETGARRISRRICEERREGRITTTARLASIVADALGVDPQSRREKIHPATRTFLALRMAVNDEMGSLRRLLSAAPGVLKAGGRFGVIAFHSVEDKEVKQDFRQRKTEGVYRILTKKPIIADGAERAVNPRSRSAKLRVVERLADQTD